MIKKFLTSVILYLALALNCHAQSNPYLESHQGAPYSVVIINYLPTGQNATKVKNDLMATGRYNVAEKDDNILLQHKEWVAGDKLWPHEIMIKKEAGVIKKCAYSYLKLPMTDETITNAILRDIKEITHEDYIMKEGDDDISYIFAQSKVVVTFPFHEKEIYVFFLSPA